MDGPVAGWGWKSQKTPEPAVGFIWVRELRLVLRPSGFQMTQTKRVPAIAGRIGWLIQVAQAG
jgi:hypothetical protein